MKKIAVMVDSGSQILPNNDKNIFVIPLVITINNVGYLDQIDITSNEVFEMMEKQDIDIKTSQPSTGCIVEIIQNIKKQGYNHILALPIASGLSSTSEGIALACNMEEIEVTIIDTKSTALIQRKLAYKAIELIENKESIEDIVSILENYIKDSATYIMTPNLSHLQKGGRITPSLAKLGGLLKIVPIMYLNYDLGGKIDVFDKVRTLKKANLIIMNVLKDKHKVDNTYDVIIEYVGCVDFAKQMQEILSDMLNVDVELNLLPAVVGGHLGVGSIGYQFIKKMSK